MKIVVLTIPKAQMNDYLDARQYAPATQRNREPILEVLLQVLPPKGTVLNEPC